MSIRFRRRRTPESFLVELIKPSHYDDSGYVIQWWRGFVPSNSLSSIYGLVQDARRRRILGESVDLEIAAYDETNQKVPVRSIIRRFARNSNRGIVLLIGVQTNQFARSLDIARELRAAGIQVAIGGFHVSGCLAMLPDMPPEMKEALALGITLFAGEGEGRIDELLAAAAGNRLKPVYNFMADLPAIESRPLPFFPRKCVDGTRALSDALMRDADAFSCSFCTIINVQGRKSRHRSADDIEQLIRTHAAQGIRSFFITDDNFARNRNWEAILDRIIKLKRRDRLKINIIMQVDTMCHKIPNFVEKAARAGCKKVFIGLENINPESLKGASKGQNRITEYRKMLQAWKRAKVLTYAGYILGFPSDTPETIAATFASSSVSFRSTSWSFHPDPAWLERSSGHVFARRADGRRYEQIRCRARNHGSSAHEHGRVGRYLPARVASLLFARAYRDVDQTRGRMRHSHQADNVDDLLFLWKPRLRAGASAAGRNPSAQAAEPTPSLVAAGKRIALLSAAGAGRGDDLCTRPLVLVATGTAPSQDRERSRIKRLYGYRDTPR